VDQVFAVPCTRQWEERETTPWLAAARGGESWALEQFFNLYQGQVYSLCFRLVGRAEDAQDATQTTFIKAFRSLPRFRGESGVRTWLYRIAINEAMSLVRSRRNTSDLADEPGPAPEPRMVERLAVEAALTQVSADHRAVLVLRFWEGLSYEEIASVLQISLSAAKMRLHRARDEFRRCYEDKA
jgi:RNA polymerase sigma-70 factor (ECF subfamily)